MVGHFPLTGHRHFTGYFLPRFTHPHAQMHFFPLSLCEYRSTNFGTCINKTGWVLVIPTKTPFTERKCDVQRSCLASLCSGDQLDVGRHTSYSERSRRRTGSPRVLSTPFHALTCAREARLVRAPYQPPPPPPPVLPPPLLTSSRYHHYYHHCYHYHSVATTTTVAISSSNTSSVLLNYYRLCYHHYQQHRRPDVAADTASLSPTSFVESKRGIRECRRRWGIAPEKIP